MKIFIIDDEEVSLFLLQRILAIDGLREDIYPFAVAEEALNAIETCNEEDLPDVILLDVNMPVMSGWEFLDALMPYWERLRNKCSIFILTSSLAVTDAEYAKKHPMIAGLIHKPISRESVGMIRARPSGFL